MNGEVITQHSNQAGQIQQTWEMTRKYYKYTVINTLNHSHSESNI